MIYLSIFLLVCFWCGWSIVTLGLRESFLYTRMEDPLVMTGPYRFYRHPQLLGAVTLAYVSLLMFQSLAGDMGSNLMFRFINFLVMVAGVVIISRFEDKDLEKRLGDQYKGISI